MLPSVSSSQIQTQVLAPQLRQGLRILAMGLSDLRSEIQREASANPALDMDDGDVPPGGVGAAETETETEEDSFGAAYLEDRSPRPADPDAAERRERFFANQAAGEGLEEHLLRQASVSDIPPADLPLVEILIGELDADGYFRGSVEELAKIAGTGEGKLRGLLRRISRFDPPGCGATNLRECLQPQLDTIRDKEMRQAVANLLPHLTDLAYVRKADPQTLAALRTLNPRPGGAFRRSGYETTAVCPEVKAVRDGNGGYRAVVEDRWLPELHVSQHYLSLIEDPKTDEATKAYVRERVAAARTLISAVDHRQDTIAAIAQAIFDAQPDFFESGMVGLRPLTMQQVADTVGVHHTTVSRTVRGKYATTPRGTFELRKFFSSGVGTETGESASATTVQIHIRDLVESEDLAHPLSDEMIVQLLRTQGFAVARRTVTKYRKRLGIPAAFRRALRPARVKKPEPAP